MFLIYVCYFNR